MNKVKNQIETKIEIRVEYDELGKPDWLENGDPEYAKQDAERLQAWKNGDWNICYVQAVVTVHNWTTGINRQYKSAGLGGVESDCEDSSILEIGLEQLAELHDEPGFPKYTHEDIEIVRNC